MTSHQYIAVDIGAESGRTIVATFDGHRIALQETHRFPNGYVRALGTMYWDILRLWQEIKVGLRESLLLGQAESVGIDTWGVDFGFVAEDGSLLGNPVHYRDARTEGIFEYAESIVPRSEIYRRTGLQFLPFNTLLQLAAARRKLGDRTFLGVDKMLLIPDLLNSFLTGQRVAEYTIASTTQMLDARAGQWDYELAERFGIPKSILPPIVMTGTKLGPLLGEVQAFTGKTNLEVIASAGHDTASAVVGVPAHGNDWAYISSGTWSLMGVEIPRPLISDQTLADNFTNEGGVGGSIRFLKNIMGMWLVQQCRRAYAEAGVDHSYSQLAELASESKPYGPIINPDDASFMNPSNMLQAIEQFCRASNQSPPEDVGDFVRTCLESLALRYRRTKEQIEASTGRSIRKIHIVGGGSQNRLLNQLTADCTGCPVTAGPIEATALGNVVVQAIALGHIQSLAEGREIVERSFPTQTYEPSAPSRKAWDEHYERFVKMIA